MRLHAAMDDKLLNQALDTAFAEPDILAGLATIAGDGDRAPLRRELEQAVRAAANEIESAAADELRRLAETELEYEAALQSPTLAQGPRLPSRSAKLVWPAAADAVARAAARRDAARETALRSVLERGVLPICRAWINERLSGRVEERLSVRLEATTAPGLAELANPDHEVPTRDGERLVRVLGQMPGGSIGLSGPRGSGKTTMLRSFDQGRRRIRGRAPGLTAMVSAPVEYSPRDFVLHVFERVCLAAGAQAESRDAVDGARDSHGARGSPARARLIIAAVGVAMATLGAGVLLAESRDGSLNGSEELTLIAGVCGGAALLALGFGSHRRRVRSLALAAATVVIVTTPVIAFADEVSPGSDWLWVGVACVWLAGHVAAAWFLSARRVPPTAIRLAVVGLAEGGMIAAAGAAGLDIGDRATTGAVVLLAATAVMAADVTLGRLVDAPDATFGWPGELIRVVVFRTTAVAQAAGLALLAFDVGVEARGVLGICLLAAGLWTVQVARADAAASRALRPELETRTPRRSAYAPDGPMFPLEVLEQVLGETDPADISPPWVTGSVFSLQSELRTWRERGQLNESLVVSRLEDILGALPAGSPLRKRLEGALWELDRRRERRDFWREAADGWLRRIRYQQSLSTTWSGRLGVAKPLLAETAWGGGRSIAELPMTLPQIVGTLQDFLGEASAVEPVVIAIDELDKMASADAAERFLNEIKAIFGVANCYFLISISEDAVASFERRGLPYRDVVDSTFDEVLRVGYLSLADTESLLDKRVVRLPRPFAALCHALSGGLARDLIRTTRTLFEVRESEDITEMRLLCRALVARELRARRDGTVTAVRSLADTLDVGAELRWLDSVPFTGLSVSHLTENPPPPARGRGGDESDAERSAVLRLGRLLREYLGFWYFCVTVSDVFSELDTELMQDKTVQPGETRDLEAFALARQSFAVDSRLAWDRISWIREAWSLDAVDHNGAGVIQRTV